MASKRPPGRPTKLTDELQGKIVKAVLNGNYIEVSCRAVGIHPTTYARWMEQGEADEENDRDTPHARFREAVMIANAEAETNALELLRQAMPSDPRMIVEWLQRRFPDRWRKRQALDIEAQANVKSEVEVVHNKPVYVVPQEERRAEVARILAAAHGDSAQN